MASGPEAPLSFSGMGGVCYDGDTCDVYAGDKNIRVRFFGIDAPEHDQKYGSQARAFTEALVRGKKLDLHCPGESYERRVCVVYQAGRNINSEVVRHGWAFDFPLFSKGHYRSLEDAAHRHRRGIWADEKRLVSPFCFRHPATRVCKEDKLFMP